MPTETSSSSCSNRPFSGAGKTAPRGAYSSPSRFSRTTASRNAATRRAVAHRTVAHKFDTRMVFIGWPVALEIIEKGRPVGREPMYLEIAQREREAVVDADQRGHVLRQPVDLNVEEHAVFAVALMPIRAFSTARAAERTARGRIDAAFSDMPKIRDALAKKGADVNARLIEELIEAHKQDKMVLRTYLTSAAGYRRHIALGTACNDLKDVLLRLHLPHFTWVT